MINRFNNEQFRGNIEGENCYLSKFVILDKEKYYFRTFDEIISFLEIPLSIVNNIKVNEDIKKYFIKILSGISAMKPLHIKEFGRYDPVYDNEEYRTKIKNIIEILYSTVSSDVELISIFETEQITLEEYNIYSKEDGYKETMERIKKGEKKSYPNKISYFTDGSKISVAFPEEFTDKYSECICIFVKEVTGDFFTDLFLELLELCSIVKLSKNCPKFQYPFITEEQVHVEIGNAVDNLIQAMTYLKNSTSFRNDKMYVFDEIEIDKKIEWTKIYLEKAILTPFKNVERGK